MSLNLEHKLDFFFFFFFFRVLDKLGGSTALFPKTLASDVDILFVLHVTICWGVCEQAES